MSEEQKQALINRCKNRIAFYKAAGNTGTFDADTLQLTEIALAALTAQQHELPDLSRLDRLAGNFLQASVDRSGRVSSAYAECAHMLAAEVKSIRAAGYQVEGE